MIATAVAKHARALVNPAQPQHAVLNEALDYVRTAVLVECTYSIRALFRSGSRVSRHRVKGWG
jgi:hypothetical protein